MDLDEEMMDMFEQKRCLYCDDDANKVRGLVLGEVAVLGKLEEALQVVGH